MEEEVDRRDGEIERKARYWFERVAEALDYWCGSIADDPLSCYSAYQDIGIGEMVYQFSGVSYPWLSEEEIEEFENESDEVVARADELMAEALEEVVEKLAEEYSEYCDEHGEDEELEDEE